MKLIKSTNMKNLLKSIDSFIAAYVKINKSEKLPDISLPKKDYEKMKEYLHKKNPFGFTFKENGFFYKNAFIKAIEMCDEECREKHER